ncbi:hypothetical protein HPB49_020214 [Dermacentor silvarum]|uniref:Uncharacterized protein n=1 Tax=Dermacentor silvarum TaxID=543639 RepID=A0ACB8CZT5_DERSI|nr:hypothetical protein HPB49_020214 [Dermacentor silvarum]
MKNGPAVDRTMSSEGGSCAYSERGVATRGTTYASLSHNATGPLCFTAWYHQSGTEHEGAHFSVMHPGDDSPLDFYVTQREMAGSWQRVRYSERRTGAVVIQITHRVKDSPEKATFAVDDLTVESGPCASERRSGSCDFDWGDTCGYEFGSGDNTWKLEDSGRESFKSIDYSTNTILADTQATSPESTDETPAYTTTNSPTATPTWADRVTGKGSSQTTELLWSRTSERLIRGEWTTVDVAFKQESGFKIQFSCSLIPEKFIPKPYCAIDAIRLYKCTGRRNFFDHHCNFEDGWCSWQNRYLPDPNVVSWLMGGEHLKTALPRPPHDHTFGNGTGSYLFVSNFERKKGDQAELIGDILSVDSTVTQCIEFWYIISGDESAELKPIFLATMGLASIPAYTALDDIAVKESHKCDTLPTSAEALSAGGLIHASGSILEPNQGLLGMFSPIVGAQTESACISVWYHMFGGRGMNVQLILSKSQPSSGFLRSTSILLHHRGRTTTDKWYNVRRTVNLDTPHNQGFLLPEREYCLPVPIRLLGVFRPVGLRPRLVRAGRVVRVNFLAVHAVPAVIRKLRKPVAPRSRGCEGFGLLSPSHTEPHAAASADDTATVVPQRRPCSRRLGDDAVATANGRVGLSADSAAASASGALTNGTSGATGNRVDGGGGVEKPRRGVIVCYYQTWAHYRPSSVNYDIEDIPTHLCTHLVYSFVGLDNSTWKVTHVDEEFDLGKGQW